MVICHALGPRKIMVVRDLHVWVISKIVGTFVTFLSLFYNATKKFSNSFYVTSTAFFDEIFVI